jgi:lipase maturation factor 1
MVTGDALNRIYRWLAEPSGSPLTESLFLRLLGLIYLAAFGSLTTQIVGLVGSRGVAPVARVMSAMHTQMGAGAYWAVPSILWLDANDGALYWCCAGGCIAAALLLAGVAQRPAAFTCWVLYLSVASAGQPFTLFQWDALLLEAGFLALFYGTALMSWAFRFLLFRLMFESGLVKLLSGDPNWKNLHAMRFHFLTQPLPTPLAYYAFRLPNWVLDFFTATALGIELLVPWLLFGPRRVRQTAAALLMLLQVVILLTGNYAFFNLLTLALCLWSFDDRTFVPLKRFLKRWAMVPAGFAPRVMAAGQALGSAAICVLVLVGASQVVGMLFPASAGPIRRLSRLLAPYQIVNSYGLFAVMTTSRPEIVIEGSDDQTNWKEYSFRFKPGELHRPLPWVAPHQPRLDWQMWFAALGSFGDNEWVGGLMYRLLVGEPTVLGLLDPAPFPKPPHYMRAQLYDYRFTTPAEREKTGAVWTRELRDTWFGPVSLTGR